MRHLNAPAPATGAAPTPTASPAVPSYVPRTPTTVPATPAAPSKCKSKHWRDDKQWRWRRRYQDSGLRYYDDRRWCPIDQFGRCSNNRRWCSNLRGQYPTNSDANQDRPRRKIDRRRRIIDWRGRPDDGRRSDSNPDPAAPTPTAPSATPARTAAAVPATAVPTATAPTVAPTTVPVTRLCGTRGCQCRREPECQGEHRRDDAALRCADHVSVPSRPTASTSVAVAEVVHNRQPVAAVVSSPLQSLRQLHRRPMHQSRRRANRRQVRQSTRLRPRRSRLLQPRAGPDRKDYCTQKGPEARHTLLRSVRYNAALSLLVEDVNEQLGKGTWQNNLGHRFLTACDTAGGCALG
jgi:hypothetical protein